MTYLLFGGIAWLANPLMTMAIIGAATVGLTFIVGRMVLRGRTSVLAKPMTVAFPFMPSYAALQTSDPFTQGPAGNHRSSARRAGTAIEVQLADAQGESNIARGLVVDRSMGGLGLEVDLPLNPGAILSLRPSSGEQRCPWIQVLITSCEQERNCWRAGCKFVRTPPWSVRLLFG